MANRGFLFGTGGGTGRDLGLLVLRLALGSLIIAHGWGKLQGFVAGETAGFPDPLGIGSAPSMGLAAFAEVFCAAAVILGLLTRWALLPLIVTMCVAIFVVHAGDSMEIKELALVYLAGYIALFFTGPGRLSIDAKLGHRRG